MHYILHDFLIKDNRTVHDMSAPLKMTKKTGHLASQTDKQRFIMSDKDRWSLCSRNNTLLPDLSVDPNVDAIQLDPLSRRCIFATLPEVIAAHDQRHPEQQA